MKSFISRHVLWALVAVCVSVVSCAEEDDPLALSVAIRGIVTNNSGVAGAIIVEIDHNMWSGANSEGHYEIMVRRDFYVDSLYAWVDKDGDKRYTRGEPNGFYHSKDTPGRAKSFQVRDTAVSNVNFEIPPTSF